MPSLPISSPAAVLAVLTGVCALFFWLEKATAWRLFQFVPPLVFIYLVPVLLTNGGVLPAKSPVYDVISDLVLPMMLVLMLLNVDVGGAVRVLGRGVAVMLMGSAGVVIGAAAGSLIFGRWFGPDTWKAFGALCGSWVGGTGNLNAVAGMFDAREQLALAVLADTSILMLWMPIMLASKRFAAPFARFAQVDPHRVARMEAAAKAHESNQAPAAYRDYLALLFVAFAVTAFATEIAGWLPIHPPLVTATTWRILLVTTIGITLSFTPLRRIPSSRELGMALIFLFMAQTGATANLEHVADEALPFLLAASVCIVTHGGFCLLGARLLHVDIHTAAIASAANIGGVATASCVAGFHKESLIPAGILMALIGYAVGNYAGYIAGVLCKLITQ